MGMQSASVQSPQTSSGKGSPISKAVDVVNQQVAPAVQPQVSQGKGASGQRYTYSPTSGQPQAGSPNHYANTVGQWDNAQISQPNRGFGKGKG
jgi:hypothetical protein